VSATLVSSATVTKADRFSTTHLYGTTTVLSVGERWIPTHLGAPGRQARGAERYVRTYFVTQEGSCAPVVQVCVTKSGAAEEGGWGRQSAEVRIDWRRPRRPAARRRSAVDARRAPARQVMASGPLQGSPGTPHAARAAVSPLSGAMVAAADLEVVDPDQCSWFAPEPYTHSCTQR
jgi:hypothetical protein